MTATNSEERGTAEFRTCRKKRATILGKGTFTNNNIRNHIYVLRKLTNENSDIFRTVERNNKKLILILETKETKINIIGRLSCNINISAATSAKNKSL